EMRVLEGRVVTRLVDGPRDRIASVRARGRLVLRHDPLGGVARPGRGDDVLEGPVEGVDQAHDGRGGGEAGFGREREGGGHRASNYLPKGAEKIRPRRVCV